MRRFAIIAALAISGVSSLGAQEIDLTYGRYFQDYYNPAWNQWVRRDVLSGGGNTLLPLRAGGLLLGSSQGSANFFWPDAGTRQTVGAVQYGQHGEQTQPLILSHAPAFSTGGGDVTDMVEQPDGKVIMVGELMLKACKTYPCPFGIARYNADGTLDTNFQIQSVSSGYRKVLLLPNGQILVGGDGYSLGNGIARLNTDGSLDSNFKLANVYVNQIYDMALASDGKILIAGLLNDGTYEKQNLLRLNSDGSLDKTFYAPVSAYSKGPNDIVRAVGIQNDGRIVIGGGFSSIQNVSQKAVARLLPDGRLDSSFVPPTQNISYVTSLLIRQNGRIMIGATFPSVGATPEKTALAQLLPTGALDPFFNRVDFGYCSYADGTCSEQMNDSVQAIKEDACGRVYTTGMGGNSARQDSSMHVYALAVRLSEKPSGICP